MEQAPQKLRVIRLGHPVLRKVAEPVPEDMFDTGRLHNLASDLIHTMRLEEGVGLAAPQVAEPLRLFAYWLPGEDEPEVEPTVLVNPEIRPVGEEQEEGWEGCLSIPGLRGLVPRYRRIKLKGRAVDGSPVSLTADGFHARVIQHEFDHLDGVVFLDRMTAMRSLAFEPEWERYVLADEDEDEEAETTA
ncbi:MAG TPA: peptide deformylase [Acidobacteria bacterium]|nr:peptide deformylase [Acidobacteriota bacterium]